MIQTIVIAIPGLLALIECIRRGPERAFLNVYLPVLLFLPEHWWSISGQYSFADTAIIPIAAFLLFRPKEKSRWSIVDFLVIGYVAITAVAEGMNKGYKIGAQNVALQDLGTILLPYFAVRHMFRQPQFVVDVAKRIAVCLTIVAIISVYEFRMGSDLFTGIWDGIFRPDVSGLFRAGFMRVQGPYGHAITLGVVMAVGFRVARWLEWNGTWNSRMPFLPISKIRFCELWIAAGSFMALSVGPWLGAACAAVMIAIFRAHDRTRATILLVILIALFGMPIYISFTDYVSVDPGAARAAGDRLQEDSAYRHKLMPLYIPVVEERPTWGWGRNEFPMLDGMGSIDNAYLFTALTFGVYALALQVALLVWPPILLGIFSLQRPRNDPRALAAISMIGIYILNVVVDGTASGGGTPWRMMFLIAGWSAALLTGTAAEVVELIPARSWPQTQLGFRKVMV
jgi:hypothetical protein